MSLVAYGSSGESSEDEGNSCSTENEEKNASDVAVQRTADKLYLPKPIHNASVKHTSIDTAVTISAKGNESFENIQFDKLPKPKNFLESINITEEDDIPPKKEIELKPEKPIKKGRAPVKITVPSLSEFKDVEEENEIKLNKIKPSNKGTKLFTLLPPPKGLEVKSTNKLIPTSVNKSNTNIDQGKIKSIKNVHINDPSIKKTTNPVATKTSIGISYDSNSEDEDDITTASGTNSTTDFFSLTTAEELPTLPDALDINVDLDSNVIKLKNDSKKNSDSHDYATNSSNANTAEACIYNSQRTLVSNVMSLPKEEILQKNKAEVGPKLPVPEQEYNVDVEGNVAFDDKAIEYLCGRRGVKRKPKEIEEVNIIEINGEDIKPDEREWLVKALTEEPIQRPISMQGGVNSQSKKKHQITYLAHQAKAMEMELKNQWAQNRLTRKQTQSKYGF